MTQRARWAKTQWAWPVRRGWVVLGAVPGPDVDEFAEADQVIAALARPGAADATLLAVQHPHQTPAALAGEDSLADALPTARRVLDRLRAQAYREAHDLIAAYRATGVDGVALGVLCMIDPAAVDASGIARVRHSEQVYPDVVAERAAVLAGLGAATSAAMLLPVDGGPALTALLADTIAELGEPEVSTVDSAGRLHELWPIGPGRRQQALLAAVQSRPLLVADGNHRVAAAAASRLSGLLALVTGGPDLHVGAIHRVLHGTGRTRAELAAAWRHIGLEVIESTSAVAARPGTIVVHTPTGDLTVELPAPGPDEPLPRIDHGVVETLLVEAALGVDPEGPLLRPLPAGRAPAPGYDAVLEIAAVPFADVLSVHEQGRRMPRKSTYFTPKPRSGLLLADLTA
ncbi:MAG TPA: DUF1015 family protein [Pseudonocardiaceae bacterium]|jgi:hypothetical protein|nr:DUF1015 family protein [Pseudonocardiaceae bacterium]